jgi:organic radical activating enzyme
MTLSNLPGENMTISDSAANLTNTGSPSDDYLRLEHSNADHSRTFVVNWCLGNTCNYACSYCPDNLHDASKPWTSYEVAENFARRVMDHYGPDRKYYFEFTGGEVSLWKDFLKLAEFLKARGARVGMISNGSRSMDWWQKARPLLDHVCMSFHPESALEKEDHFFEVAKFLSEGLRLHLNVMMSPEKFDACYAVATRLKNIPNVSIAMQPLIVNFGSELYKYTPAQHHIMDKQYDLIVKHIKHTREFEYFRGAMQKVYADGRRVSQAPHRFINNGQNNWAGWKCKVGLEQIVVDFDGKVFRGWCLVGDSLGHVADPDFKFPTEAITCTKTMCHCNFDIMATKYRANAAVETGVSP